LLTLGVYPDETIKLSFETKNHGPKVCLRSVTMDFSYQSDFSGPNLDAYEKAILDCMLGDQTLFWRQDAVELAWSFLEPVLEHCETCADRRSRLFPYAAGSWGPDAATAWRD
jgi:glucose-6-phosphate 1-dehydrogenase